LQKLASRLSADQYQQCQQALIDQNREQLVNLLLNYYDQTINYQPQNILHRLSGDGKTPMEIAKQIQQLV